MTDLKKTIEDSWYTTLDTYSKSNKNTAGFDPYWSFDDIAKIKQDSQPRQPAGRSPVPSVAIYNSANGVSGPPIGTVKSGYKFKGGNPNDKNNWVKQ